MTVTAISTVAAGQDTNTSMATTASYAWQNNKLYTMVTAIDAGASVTGTVTSMTGGGLTWVQVTTLPFSSTTRRLDIWRALVASGATTDVITIGLSKTHSRLRWAGAEWSGMDTTGTNGSGAIANNYALLSTAASTAINTIYPNAVTAGSALFGTFARAASSNLWASSTPASTYTAVAVGSGAEALNVFLEYDSSRANPNVGAVWTGSVVCIVEAIEILPAAAAGAVIRQLLPSHLTGQGQNRFMGNFVEFVTMKPVYCYEDNS